MDGSTTPRPGYNDFDLINIDFSKLFELSEPEMVDSDLVLQDGGFTMYEVNAVDRTLTLAESDIDLTSVPFLHEAQFEHATRLVTMSFEEVASIMPSVPVPPRVIYIANPARSGSTLLQRMLNRVDGVASFGEATTPTVVRFLREFDPGNFSPEEIDQLLVYTMQLLMAPWADQTVAVKLRAADMPVLSELVAQRPDARTVMIHRDALSIGASWKNQATKNNWSHMSGDVDLETVTRFQLATATTTETLRRWMAKHGRDTMPQAVAFAALWMYAIESYLRALEQGISSIVLDYDDLRREPHAVMAKVFDYLSLDRDKVANAVGAMEVDSQAGTLMARRDGRPNETELDEQEKEWVREVLAMHPMSLTPEMELPGTVRP